MCHDLFPGAFNRCWGNPVFFVIRHLDRAPAVGFINGIPHSIRRFVGIEQNEPIRIPGAEDYRAPEALREQILDAMQEGLAPSDFAEQVQR